MRRMRIARRPRGDRGEHSPYRGMWVICLLMIAVPLSLYWIFSALLDGYRSQQQELNRISVRILAAGLGLIFYLSCAVAGAFRKAFSVVVQRVSDFFDNLSVSLRFALKYYWEDVRMEGVAFLIYFIIILACAVWFVDGLLDYAALA